MKNKKILALALAAALVLTGCGSSSAVDADVIGGKESGSAASGQAAGDAAGADGTGNGSGTSTELTALNPDDIFSDRDFETDYDESKSAVITLNGSSAQCSSDAVEISGTTITIRDEGTYIISGTLDDGMIIVNSDKDDKTQIVLNGVNIHSKTCAPIYVLQSDKVFITLAEGTVNSLSNGGSFIPIDDNNIDSVIFSKEDLTLNGAGSLTISSPGGHGIVSKDELTVTGGTYDITCASHGVSGKDGVGIANAVMNIVSGKDGIHGENDDDETLGYVYIQSGTLEIAAQGDGVSAQSMMQIDSGSFHIVSGGGNTNAAEQDSSDFGKGGGFGGFGGGKPDGMGGMGGKRQESSGNKAESLAGSSRVPEGNTAEDASTEDISCKGLKASGLIVNGGSFSIDSSDDAVHANGSIAVNDGTFAIATGDDGFHADETLTINGGTIDISKSYEGLEGLHVEINGGEIALVASDDGLNAAGGVDSSGFGGRGGNDMFGGRGGKMGGASGGSSSGTITITGGNLYVRASGDGMDANGSLSISGGTIQVFGPNQGDTATLDYDTSAVITGGTFMGSGAKAMAQTFSDSEQGVVSVSVGNTSAGTEVTLKSQSGNVMMTFTPELDFSVVILSSSEMVSGETYTLTVGSRTADFTAE